MYQREVACEGSVSQGELHELKAESKEIEGILSSKSLVNARIVSTRRTFVWCQCIKYDRAYSLELTHALTVCAATRLG